MGTIPSKRVPYRLREVVQQDREDRVERLLRGGFRARIDRFLETGSGVTLEEVPEALDGLLDLNVTELERLVQKMGFDVLQLRHRDGSPLGRLTPDFVVQLLGGMREGQREPLPTTPEEAELRLKAVERQARALRSAPAATDLGRRSDLLAKLETLQNQHEALTSVRDELRALPRVKGRGELGLVAAVMYSVGSDNPLRERESGKPPLRGKLLGHSVAIGAGLGLSRVDRFTGKRKVVPYAQLSADMGLGGVTYTLKPDERQVDASFRPLFLTIGNDPVCGRHIYFAPPLGFSFTVGERFVGIGVPFWTRSLKGWLKGGPSLLLGLRGDPIQHFTGPAIRWCFKLYEGFKSMLPGKSPPQAPAESIPAASDEPPSDWLVPGVTLTQRTA